MNGYLSRRRGELGSIIIFSISLPFSTIPDLFLIILSFWFNYESELFALNVFSSIQHVLTKFHSK